MFDRKTVFVVAAGASAELGLPVGDGLMTKISEMISPDEGEPIFFVNPEMNMAVGALAERLHIEESLMTISAINTAAYTIDANMPLSPSVDTFLHARQSDKLTVSLGKLLIAKAILDAERKSHLYDRVKGIYTLPTKNDHLKRSWHLQFWQRLVAGVRVEDVDSIFNNVSFIVFNYDRCLEHFLYHSLQLYFSIPPEKAAAIMARVDIIHPYGKVGNLPWQVDGGDTPYGWEHPTDLLSIALELKTFTESAESGTIQKIHGCIRKADAMVLLGFGYLQQNMDLMRTFSNVRHVFMTTKGLSYNDSLVAVDKIGQMLGKQPNRAVLGSHIGRDEFEVAIVDGKCSQLFDEHRLRIVG